MLNSAQFSPIKESINILIEQIISYEDQIKELEINPSYHTAAADLTKNKESIALLQQFIKNESSISSHQLNKKQSEFNSLQKQISLVEAELLKIKYTYTQKDLDHEYAKQKCFEKTIELYNNELVSYVSNIELLKEEKLTIEYDIVNQMSLKETYEESIKVNAQLMFKNLIISYENAIATSTANLVMSTNHIEVDFYELNYASMNKVSTFAFETLTEYISSLQSLDKSLLCSIVSDSYTKYMNNHSYDFFSSVTRDLMNSNPKFNDFIQPEKFKRMLMLCVKVSALEKVISNKIAFINNIYKPRKQELKSLIAEDRDKISKIQQKLNDAIFEIEKKASYLDYKKDLDIMRTRINEIEKDINQLTTESNKNVSNYQIQINDLEKINSLLEKKYNPEKNEDKILQLKKKIDDIFYQIKNTIKDSDQPNEVLNRFINDLNISNGRNGKNTNEQKSTKPKPGLKKKKESSAQKKIDDIPDIEDILNTNENNNNDCSKNEDENINTIPKDCSLELSNSNIDNDSSPNNNVDFKYTESNLPTIYKELTTIPSVTTTTNRYQDTQSNKRENASFSFINPKISVLYNKTECYSHVQELNDTTNQFNPLVDFDIIPEEKDFTKSDICLSNDNQNIIIKLYNKEAKHFSIALIDKTLVTGSMKKVITIIQHSKGRELKDVLSNPVINDLNLSNEDIIKATNNKYFLITVILNISKKINLLFLNYDVFKQWLNGFAYIIKNKASMLKNYES